MNIQKNDTASRVVSQNKSINSSDTSSSNIQNQNISTGGNDTSNKIDSQLVTSDAHDYVSKPINNQNVKINSKDNAINIPTQSKNVNELDHSTKDNIPFQEVKVKSDTVDSKNVPFQEVRPQVKDRIEPITRAENQIKVTKRTIEIRET